MSSPNLLSRRLLAISGLAVGSKPMDLTWVETLPLPTGTSADYYRLLEVDFRLLSVKIMRPSPMGHGGSEWLMQAFRRYSSAEEYNGYNQTRPP
jgi:hypothetical protein